MRGKALPPDFTEREQGTLYGYLEDFFVALNFPHAVNWAKQPPQWKQAMRLLSITWEIGRLQLTKMTVEKD